MADARFEDTTERPLRLRAETVEDLAVISALLQDAVGKVGNIAWAAKHRRFALLLCRFRWEDREAAERSGRPYERVPTTLAIDGALRVRSNGIGPRDRDTVFELLSIGFEPGEDCGGTVRLVLAGDGEIAVEVECLDVILVDVARPYAAAARRPPEHGE